MKTFISIILILLVSACTETARENLSRAKKLKVEKVVIISLYSSTFSANTYKIKRLSTGTMDYVKTNYPYEPNDTILYTFVE